jgi:hypothetical protein
MSSDEVLKNAEVMSSIKRLEKEKEDMKREMKNGVQKFR